MGLMQEPHLLSIIRVMACISSFWNCGEQLGVSSPLAGCLRERCTGQGRAESRMGRNHIVPRAVGRRATWESGPRQGGIEVANRNNRL
jgi:hypothetical protein